MVAQEEVKRNGFAGKRIRRNLSGFAHDVVTLGELQCRLLAVDLRDAKKVIIPGTALIVGGILVAFAALPIMLAAFALTLSQLAGWSFAASFGIVAGGALLLAASLAVFVWSMFQKAIGRFDRSRVELKETYRWVRDSLRPASNPSDEESSH